MPERFEEEPEPDVDPEEDPDEEPAAPVSASGSTVPVVGGGGREFDYRTEALERDQVGAPLAELLTKASADGWDLVEVIAAGDRHVVLLRKAKKADRQSRPVGFARPG